MEGERERLAGVGREKERERQGESRRSRDAIDSKRRTDSTSTADAVRASGTRDRHWQRHRLTGKYAAIACESQSR